MKTMEERAKAYYEGDLELLQTRGWLDRSDIADIVEKAYIQGATEQKAIDDDAVHAIVEEQVLKAIEKQKAIDIGKACKWVDDNVGTLSAIALRKAMEE